jgi:serine phosphatase RsbU (regulator of sigma subunit)
VNRHASEPATAGRVEVLLIEDDHGDALLVREMLAESAADVHLTWVRSIGEARPLLHDRTGCVLLDLQLPDADGFSGLDVVLKAAPRAAVIVLTGFADQTRGLQAMARGAQDYLAKAAVEPELLARAIRYALERRAAQDIAQELIESKILAAENTRLERGLLPVAILHDNSVSLTTRYRSGRGLGLLGGDFYDLVQCPDGTIYALVGDVCGHGPDEAALGVCLRVAWRTLILAGTNEKEILPLVAAVLEHERASDHIFATACMVRVAADHRGARVYLAGHPPPLLNGALIDRPGGVPLGVRADRTWDPSDIELPECWQLMLFTDGIFEGATGVGRHERLGLEGFCDLAAQATAEQRDPELWLDSLIFGVEALNGGPLADDVAVLVLRPGRDSPTGPEPAGSAAKVPTA